MLGSGRIEFTCKLKPVMCERVPRVLKRLCGREQILQASGTPKETVLHGVAQLHNKKRSFFSPYFVYVLCLVGGKEG